MGLHVHRLTKQRIDRLFTANLCPTDRDGIFAALDRCSVCADYYRKHQALESSLCGTEDPVTHFSIERTGVSILASAESSAVPPKGFQLFRRIVVVPAAAFAAALAVAWILLPDALAPDRVGMPAGAVISPITAVARGGRSKKSEADVGIRLFHVVENGKAANEESDLSIDDIITFTYTQVNRSGGRLALFGMQETGEIRWYYPGYGEKTSIPIEGDKVDEPLKDGISLAVNHTPGWLRITALFTETPLSTEEIEAAAAALRKDPKRVRDLSPIPLAESSTSPIQYSVMVKIGGRK